MKCQYLSKQTSKGKGKREDGCCTRMYIITHDDKRIALPCNIARGLPGAKHYCPEALDGDVAGSSLLGTLNRAVDVDAGHKKITCRDCKRVFDCPSAAQGHVCDEIEKED